MIVVSADTKHYASIYKFCQDNTGDDRVCAIHTGGKESDNYEILIYPSATRRAYKYDGGYLLSGCIIWGDKVWGRLEKDGKESNFETSLQNFRKVVRQNKDDESPVYKLQSEEDVVRMFSEALPKCITCADFKIEMK